jgi:hypothetical protein
MGRLAADHFVVETPHARKASPVESVAAHTLYERSNPVWLPGPASTVDLQQSGLTRSAPIESPSVAAGSIRLRATP